MNLFTEFKEGFKISCGAIRANPLRSGLTTLGIIIGVVTVTLMGTAIEGLNRAFMNSIAAIGADVLYVQREPWFIESHAEWVRIDKRPFITLAQAKRLAAELPSAAAVAPVAGTRERIQFGNRNSSMVTILGTTEHFLATSGVNVLEGRFLTPGEVAGGRPVCVLGMGVATNLVEQGSAVGEKLRLGGRLYEVVGVLDKQGNLLGSFSLDNQVIIPIQQFIAYFWTNPNMEIHVKAGNLMALDDVKEEIRGVFRRIRKLTPIKEDDFSINQQDMIIKSFRKVAGMIAGIGLFITGLSLFVGGIGIMNIMFVSVAERTQEIGLRKAIGAKRRTILLQFLIEAALICLLGGTLAVLLATPMTFALSKLLPAKMSITIISVALIVSAVTGLASGFFPAWKASLLKPVDALRHE